MLRFLALASFALLGTTLASAQLAAPDGYEPDGAVDIVFLNTTGGQIQDVEFEWDGAIDIVSIEVGFQSYDADSWAADLAMALIAPNGNTVHWGGYDLFFNYEQYAGPFPDSWRISAPDVPNFHIAELNLGAYNLEGAGTWTMRLMNGYSQSDGSQWGGQMIFGDCEGCIIDCNGNLIEDVKDIAGGTSEDCDGNSIPDECQADCDNDGIPDACELDDDGDFIPNDCEFDAGVPIGFSLTGPGNATTSLTFAHDRSISRVIVEFDFQTDDLWTWASDLLIAIENPEGDIIQLGGWDVDMGVDDGSFPSDMNSHLPGTYDHTFILPQRFEGTSGEWTLHFTNGYSQSRGATWAGLVDIGQNANYLIDCNFNGVDDTDEILAGDVEDCDGNGIPDTCDLLTGGDGNGDGSLDSCQIDCTVQPQFDFDGTASDLAEVTFEFDGDVISLEVNVTFDSMSGDQTWAGDLCVALQSPSGASVQLGGFDHAFEDITMIGDFPSAWDKRARGSYSGATFALGSHALSGSGTWTIYVTNGFAASAGAAWKGTLTLCALDEVLVPLSDCNGNGIEDKEDVVAGSEDCNANGVPDTCDIDNGALDTNGNLRIDSCELAEGDLNLDGCVNGEDLGLFWLVFGVDDPPYGDLDGDGDVDVDDFDILQSNFDDTCVPLG